MPEIIDTHIHIWNLEKNRYAWLDNDVSILRRTYLLDELEEERSAIGVSGGVLVQAANTKEETAYMLEVAEENEWIRGVVGWSPLLHPDQSGVWVEEKLKHPMFKGVRHLIHDEPDEKWLLQEPVLESLGFLAENSIPYDMVGTTIAHLDTVLQVQKKLPHLKMVLDHLNQPPLDEHDFSSWKERMKELSHNPHACVKISGLGTALKHSGEWIEKDWMNAIGFVLEHFGTDRCFCGGDWPVSLLGGTYTDTWKMYLKVFDALLDEEDKEKLLKKNADTFYKL